MDKVSESVTTAADKVAAALQPGQCSINSLSISFSNRHRNSGDSKSTSQELSDTVRSKTDSEENTGPGIVQQASDAIASAYDTVTQKASGMSALRMPLGDSWKGKLN